MRVTKIALVLICRRRLDFQLISEPALSGEAEEEERDQNSVFDLPHIRNFQKVLVDGKQPK